MPNYQQGKIYKITSGDLIYIGSTTEPTLARRLSGHVTQYKSLKDGKSKNYTTSFQLIETGNYEITLIELFPCNSKDELTARERFYIDNAVCVNKVLPGQSRKEWFEKHKKESDKAYYEKNKEEMLVKMKIYNDTHKEQMKKARKIHYEAHKEQILQKLKIYNETHKEQLTAYNKENYQKKKEERLKKYQSTLEKCS